MDRVNRRFLVASTLTAIPAAMLMASLTHGTTPENRLAVMHGNKDSNAIQQVVGKQLETPTTRPGLLQVLSGRAAPSNQDHNTAHSDQPKGLLDELFGGRSKNSDTHHRHTHQHHTHQHHTDSQHPRSTRTGSAATTNQRGNRDVDWNGIPYHDANATGQPTVATPIRDPSPAVAKTRIIRGGSSRSIPATTASARVPSVMSTRREAGPLAVPVPPTDHTKFRSTSPVLSNNGSSRRSGRREVNTFDASDSASSASRPAARVSRSDEAVADLVPRVSRKAMPQPATTETKETKDKPKLAPAPAPAKVAQEKVSKPVSDAAAPKPQTAVAALTPPAAKPAADSEVAQSVPTANLSAPTAVPRPAYTTPVDPAKTPVPTQPYAASTPSLPIQSTPATSVSHRAGPPHAAFTGEPISMESYPIAGHHLYSPANPYQSPPLPSPNGYNGSAAIGSGVANGDTASYRRPASQPEYRTALLPQNPYNDPYGRRDYGSSERMSTYGQPLNREPSSDSPSNLTSRATRQPQQTAIVPMHPIDGYQTQHTPSLAVGRTASRPGSANSFSHPINDSSNQMRNGESLIVPRGGATIVASELPGIRVVTNGPGEIMIRQNNEYEIRVENRGSIDAQGLIVRAMIPDWAEVRGQNATRGNVDSQGQGSTERLVWTIDHLPAGASEQMFVRLMAARSGTYNLDVDWTLVPQKSATQVRVHEPRLDLTIEGPEQVVYGQSQTYKVRVLNPGDGMAPNVVFTLSPNSATPQTQRIGDIPPGKEAQFDVELTAQDLGDLKIHGLAMGDLELRAEGSKTIHVAAAQLEAILTGPELKYQNTDAMYNLQIQNSGSAPSEKIVATLRMPAGVKYLGGIERASVHVNTLKWEINRLNPGATRDYQFRCSMNATGEHLFSFDCKGTAAGHAGVSIATRVESISDLVLSITDPPAPAPIGSEVVYEIIVRNRGSREATDVRAIAQFSNGIEPQRIDGQSGEVVTGQVLFDPIPRIGAGEEVRLRVVAIAEKAGHHRFRTEIRSGDTVLVAEEATHFMSPQSDRISRRSSDNQRR